MFKHLYNTNSKRLYKRLFEKHYRKGFFGTTISKDTLFEHNQSIYDSMKTKILEKDFHFLNEYLNENNNKFYKDIFKHLTGIDVRYEKKEDVCRMITEYCEK